MNDSFSKEWYAKAPFNEMYWQGWPIVKCPLDLHQYQEIIWQTKPEAIIETGTYAGGSALFLANMLDIQGSGDVLTIDILVNPDLPEHPRIQYMQGLSSIDLRVIERVKKFCLGKKTMVILDSYHSKEHVLKELKLYAPFVSKGAYLIVEDTLQYAYSSQPTRDFEVEGGGMKYYPPGMKPQGKGDLRVDGEDVQYAPPAGKSIAQQDGSEGTPGDALREWQPPNKGFLVDKRRERFLFTQNENGYLKKVR